MYKEGSNLKSYYQKDWKTQHEGYNWPKITKLTKFTTENPGGLNMLYRCHDLKPIECIEKSILVQNIHCKPKKFHAYESTTKKTYNSK